MALLTLPQATGGPGKLTYSLSGLLPPGLVFNAENRTLLGTPSAAQPAQAYDYTATSLYGQATTLTFTIEVKEDTP